MKKIVIIVALLVGVLAFLNPDEADFREHVREKQGIAGTLGMAAADLLSGGIRRENYIIASRFYLGGDGIIPRENLAWGIAGRFFSSGD